MKNVAQETDVTLIGPHCKIQGTLELKGMVRIHGRIEGKISAGSESEVILTETGLLEGDFEGPELIVEGCVRGNIHATKRLHISSKGRVIGSIRGKDVQIDPGAWIEVDFRMESSSRPS